MVDRIEEIAKKFGAKIEGSLRTESVSENYSREYSKFKEEINPTLSNYEKYCKKLGSLFKLKLGQKDNERLVKSLGIAHVDVAPEEAAGFAMVSFVAAILFSLLLAMILYLVAKIEMSVMLPAIFLLFLSAIFVYYYINSLPDRMAQSWRLKASSQMVPCILYIVVFMRHTSNLEMAIKFASQHLQPPLALDLKKIFWDVETGKYSTIKEALDAYLETWRDYSMEFIEAFHLIESSLYEPSEGRRVEILEKSLSVILEGVYDKMLKYTHDVQSPLTNLYMLGIVLPTLAIALLPLMSALVGDMIKWWHIAIVFNLIIPFFVFYMTSDVLRKRPGGYGETELLEMNPDYPYYKSKKHYYNAAMIAVPLILLGILPIIFQFTHLPGLFGLQKDYTFQQFGISMLADNCIFDFKNKVGACALGDATVGPFGLGALLLSLLIPLGIALFFSMSYKSKTKRLLKTRDDTKALEGEFASSLFQLGNRLGDGIPAEMAFGRVAESLKGTPTENFFKTVNSNIQQLGMSVREAIFNPQRGAIIYFPSPLIRTSMEILTESVKKGLQVAARALMSISQYVKNIGKINERLKDLLADIISSMKSNMAFLAPLLAGIVVGLAAMITLIMNRLSTMLVGGTVTKDTMLGGLTSIGTLTDMFSLTKMIPPYFIQLITGVYLVEIIYILTITLVTVESGVDKLSEKAEIADNMQKGMLLYIAASLVSIISLSLLAAVAISGMVAG